MLKWCVLSRGRWSKSHQVCAVSDTKWTEVDCKHGLWNNINHKTHFNERHSVFVALLYQGMNAVLNTLSQYHINTLQVKLFTANFWERSKINKLWYWFHITQNKMNNFVTYCITLWSHFFKNTMTGQWLDFSLVTQFAHLSCQLFLKQSAESQLYTRQHVWAGSKNGVVKTWSTSALPKVCSDWMQS